MQSMWENMASVAGEALQSAIPEKIQTGLGACELFHYKWMCLNTFPAFA